MGGWGELDTRAGLWPISLLSPVDHCLAAKRVPEWDPGMVEPGISCLDELHISDADPCLA